MMKKKLFALLLATVLLAGCTAGGTGKKKKKKTDVVTSVTLNRSELTFNLNEEHRYTVETLIVTVSGEGDFDQSVSWTTSNDSVATVDNGVVSAVDLGTATIKAQSNSNKDTYALCEISVVNDIPVIESVSISPESPTLDIYHSKTLQLTAEVKGKNGPSQQVMWSSQSSVFSVDQNGLITATKEGTGTVKATSAKDTSKSCTVNVTVADSTPKVNSVTIMDGTSAAGNNYVLDIYTANQKTKEFTAKVDATTGVSQEVIWESSEPTKVSVSNGLVTALQTTVTPITITAKSKFDTSKVDTINVTVNDSTPRVTNVTVTLSSSTVRLNKTTTASYSVDVVGGLAKTATWSSSNTSVATIDANGNISPKALGKTNIIATSTADTTKFGQASLEVLEAKDQDAYTIMIYMCGSDLESGSLASQGGSQGGEASADIKEILAATQTQPDDVHIIIETGGSSKWHKIGSITPSTTKLERYEVKQNVIEKVGEDTTANNKMSTTSALQSFIEWGINNYPADKMALVFWDHGDGIFGCCYDENNNDDCLIPTEITGALKGAFQTTGFTDKLEWIGYDCCLKQNADETSINCEYAKYQIAAQISEAGEGWYYTPWVNELYKNKEIATSTLLTKICDDFVSYYEYLKSENDQTLSWVYLDRMTTFTNAFNEFTSGCNNKDYYDALIDKIDNILAFEADMGAYDMEDTLEQLGASSTSTVMNALHNLVGHVAYYKNADFYSQSKPSGLNSFIATCDEGSYVKKSYYSTNATRFTNWRLMNINYGFESLGGDDDWGDWGW